MDLKHQILCEIKKLTSELGRRPTRNEFCHHTSYTRHNLECVFGSWTDAIKAAGLTEKQEKSSTKKVVEEFFTRDIKDFIRSSDDQPLSPALIEKHKKKNPTIICLGDLHCPWWDENAMSLVYYYIETIQPDFVIQMGDSYDFYAYSKFPKAQVDFTPRQELQTARSQLESMWSRIHSLAPSAALVQILGNHCIRPHKRVLEAGSELALFMNFNKWFEFENVHTHFDTRSPYMIGDIAFIHGYLSGQGRHRNKLLTHVVHGHTHCGGLIHNKSPQTGTHLWELDVGFLGDPSQKCFHYTAVKEFKWTKGIGLITAYGPSFISFDD